MSLAYIYPDKAEKYAIDFWHRDKYKDNDYKNFLLSRKIFWFCKNIGNKMY